MNEPTYRQALAHAWDFVWHNKIVWILGLLAVFAGQFGLSNFVGTLMVSGQKLGSASAVVWPGTFFDDKWTGGWWTIFGMGWLALIITLLGILVVLAAVAAQGALVAANGYFYKNRIAPNLDAAWHIGVKHFWRLLAIDAAQYVLLALLLRLLFFLWMIVAAHPGTVWTILTLVVTAVIFFAALVISTVAIYAVGCVVMEERPVRAAIFSGWELFRGHVLVSLETSLLLLLLNIAVAVATVLIAVMLLTPVALLATAGGITGYTGLLTLGWIIWLAFFLLAAALIGGVYNAYLISTWMYLFMTMRRGGIMSRVMRWFKNMVNKLAVDKSG